MIKASFIPNNKRKYSCDNCNKEIIHCGIKYSFYDKDKEKESSKLHLCEECSNGMANLHYKVMENGENFNFNEDFKIIKEPV